jgi:hypothetical protein
MNTNRSNANTLTLAKECGGELQAALLISLVSGNAGLAHWPAGCFISLCRRGLIDGNDNVTAAGRDAITRANGAA